MDQFYNNQSSHSIDIGTVTSDMMGFFTSENANSIQVENQPVTCGNSTYMGWSSETAAGAAVQPQAVPAVVEALPSVQAIPGIPNGQAIQIFRAVKEAARAESARIDAQARHRREEEVRNTVDNDCQITPCNGAICALTKDKVFKPVLSKIPVVYRIDTDKLYSTDPYYLLGFSAPTQCCVIPVCDLCKPGKLASALAAQAPDVQFFVYEKEKKLVLEGLAQYFRREAKAYPYRFFHGWIETEGSFFFYQLDGTTHGAALPQLPEDIKEAELFQSDSTATTIIATQQITELFKLIDGRGIQQLLFIWAHLCFTYSLLKGIGYEPSVGLCILCKNAQSFRLLETIFRWNTDPTISTSENIACFVTQLADRKDQALLLRSPAQNIVTEAITLNVIKNHTIPSPLRDASPLPQQAPITLLAQGTATVIRDPVLLTVEIESIDLAALNGQKAFASCWNDYWKGFAHFTSTHISVLKEKLEDAYYSEELDWDTDTTPSFEGGEFLALYRGLLEFLKEYLLDLDPLQRKVFDTLDLLAEGEEYLISLIERSNSSKGYDCERFLLAAQRCLEAGTILLVDMLKPIPAAQCQKDAPATVFFDREFCYFNQAAYKTIVSATKIPVRELTSSLKEAGILSGPFVNTGSFQTRLPTKNTELKEGVNVYKIEQPYIDKDRGAKSFFRR